MEILELERQIDNYLRDDIPLTILTDNNYLTKNQWALLISKIRGYEELQMREDIKGSIPPEYFEFSHEIPEEYPTTNEERIDLFIKLRELESKIKEYEIELKECKESLEMFDEDLVNKINNLIKVLESGTIIEYSKLEGIFQKEGLTLSKISFYEALYEKYQNTIKRLENLKKELKDNEYKKEDIKRELIKTNIKLPNWVIRSFFRGIALPIEDTQQVANQALLRAIDGFDPKRGTTFSTYAVPIIIHEIERDFKKLYGVSWNDYVNMTKLDEYRSGSQEEDINEQTGLSDGQIAGLDGMVKQVMPFADAFPEEPSNDRITRYRLENPLDGVDFIDLYSEKDLENIPDPSADNAMEEVELRDLHRLLQERIEKTLTEKEKFVLDHLFDLSGNHGRIYTRKEVGDLLNVTQERVRMIEAKALRKLRHPRNSNVLKDYIPTRPRLYLREERIDYNKVFKRLISLLSLDMSDESILIFMNMEGVHWDLIDLYTEIDIINQIADFAVDEYEQGLDYYQISNRISSRFRVYLNIEFITYLIHKYMKTEKREESVRAI